MGEFLYDRGGVEEVFDACFHEVHRKNVVHTRAFIGVLAKQTESEVFCLAAVVARDRLRRVIADAHHERRHRVCCERWLQRTEFVEDGAQ